MKSIKIKLNFLDQLWKRDFPSYTTTENYLWETALTRFALNTLGLWPENRQISKLKFIVSTAIIFIVLELPSVGGLFFTANNKNILNYVIAVSLFPCLLVSMFTMRYNIELCGSVVDEIRENWINEASVESQKIMHHYAKRTITTSLIELVLTTMSAGSYALAPFVNAIATDAKVTEKTIGEMWYPYSTSNPYIYGFTYIMQLIAVVVQAVAFLGIDWCLFLFIFHTCGQLTILAHRIDMYDGKVQHRSEVTEDNLCWCNCIKCIVDHHVKIYKFVEKVNNYFNIVLLVRLVASTIHLCCVGYDILKATERGQFAEAVLSITYLLFMTMTLFVYCWLGQQCLQKGATLAEAAFGMWWVNRNPKILKHRILLIRQSQVPLKITAGSFFTMSLHLYKEYIFAAMSYLSVLLAIKLDR